MVGPISLGSVALLLSVLAPTLNTNSPQHAADQDQLRAVVEPATASLVRGKQPVLRYRYKEVPFKPYIRELYTPGGVNVLLDAPPDHKHHHGLMFAVKADGVSFWEETATAGRQVHRNIEAARTVAQDEQASVTLTERLDWLSSDENLLLREQRTIQVHADPNLAKMSATLLTWSTRLEPASGSDVTITGNHYYGLGMRFVRSMDHTGKFTNAESKSGMVFRGDERLVRSKWCAYTATVDGKPVTVAMFDHPDNTRAATWFTMKSPFAYLSATLAYHEQSLKIEPNRPLELRYGVAVCDGPLDAARIEKLYRLWLTRWAPVSKLERKPGGDGKPQP